MIAPTDVVALLRRTRLAATGEAALQLSLEAALGATGWPVEREARLSAADRIDFLVDGAIGIEAKVRHPRRAIFRQLERYAAHERIAALILVTGTAMGLPFAVVGKPLFYVSLGRSAL